VDDRPVVLSTLEYAGALPGSFENVDDPARVRFVDAIATIEGEVTPDRSANALQRQASRLRNALGEPSLMVTPSELSTKPREAGLSVAYVGDDRFGSPAPEISAS
jgi:hypothetical protein